MSSQAIFSFLGGGGVVSVVLALIAWARNKGNDEADVAKNWESGVSMLLRSAQEQVKHLDSDLARMRRTASETRHELDETREELAGARQDIREIRNILDDTLRDLEQRGGDTSSYRERAARLRAV